jgi:molybdopterin biosynthesis enzyme MoaB
VALSEGKPVLRVAAITVSDTRTDADDEGGKRLRERLEAAGFTVSFRAIVPDDRASSAPSSSACATKTWPTPS